MRTSTIILVVLLSMVVSGCANSASGDQSHPASASVSRCAIPRTVVVGIDRSGSYSLTGAGIEQIARLLERVACPGDTWYLRWIEEDSYRASAAIHTVAFEALPPQPTAPANPLARRTREEGLRAWDATRRKFLKGRSEAAGLLRAQVPPTAGASDVVGFFLKGDELLETTARPSQRVVVVATDLRHNIERDGEFQLHGAHVILLVFQADDPHEARALRAAWLDRLTQAGAASVRFHDPMEPVDHVLDAPATASKR